MAHSVCADLVDNARKQFLNDQHSCNCITDPLHVVLTFCQKH